MLMLRCFFLAFDDEFEPVELRRLPDMMAAWENYEFERRCGGECELLNYLLECNDVNNIVALTSKSYSCCDGLDATTNVHV